MMSKLLYLLFYLNSVFMYRHQKQLAEKMWKEKCKKNSVVLNDCNWCWCDQNQRYQCKSRVCEDVDIFGHFKDTIQEIDVGMEGRGSWRSRQSSCTPGVEYRRGTVLCVCDEDGNWPNPVCRDLFRVLHSVEVTERSNLSKTDSCEPMKLYLVGCNVCFCPSASILDPLLCTNKECTEDDPVFETKTTSALELLYSKSLKNDDNKILEIYATCNHNNKYKMGCRQCDCLSNNRLLCDKCSENQQTHNSPYIYNNQPVLRTLPKNYKKSYCKGKSVGQIFQIDCNFCHCDEKLNMICSTKNCMKGKIASKAKKQLRLKRSGTFKPVNSPADVNACVPGTKFKKHCNKCKCHQLENGTKVVDCTKWPCLSDDVTEFQNNDCVKDSVYEKDCMFCICSVVRKTKYESCYVSKACMESKPQPEAGVVALNLIEQDLIPIEDMHGYCEPFRKYKKDCNICHCMADGKSLHCTANQCQQRRDLRSVESLSVDLVPVYMKVRESCPKGKSHKIDCNTCYCLSNGNAICTANDCSKNKKERLQKLYKLSEKIRQDESHFKYI